MKLLAVHPSGLMFAQAYLRLEPPASNLSRLQRAVPVTRRAFAIFKPSRRQATPA